MPVMNFDLEDGKPKISFALKVEDAERFIAFMAECSEYKRQNEELRAELDGDDLPLRDKLAMAEGLIASQLERMAELQRQVREYRGLLLWALYHHQGGTSHVGLPIRRAIGIGEYDRMSAEQIAEAKRVVSSRAAITKDQTHD